MTKKFVKIYFHTFLTILGYSIRHFLLQKVFSLDFSLARDKYRTNGMQHIFETVYHGTLQNYFLSYFLFIGWIFVASPCRYSRDLHSLPLTLKQAHFSFPDCSRNKFHRIWSLTSVLFFNLRAERCQNR